MNKLTIPDFSRIAVNKRKILNDPVYGFISIPDDLVFDLINHPVFQRLNRIRQLGLTYLVYPGAIHTRFHHAVGAMHLMDQAIEILRSKGQSITDEEKQASLAAILLHDIGHGPFSHALEFSIISGVHHEMLSLALMDRINKEFGDALKMAMQIFTNQYSKRFLHQLLSSQLDVDRLDYLTRDSFFTGVSEGIVGTERILKMMNVVNDELVIEEKGIYSIEKFIMARRLMYWQVYYHKTVVSAEIMLINILKRAHFLSLGGEKLFGSPHLQYFLENQIGKDQLNEETLLHFSLLDDSDILSSLKVWQEHADPVLSRLCGGLINRRLFKLVLQKDSIDEVLMTRIKRKVCEQYMIDESLADYFVFSGQIENNAYKPEQDKILISFRNGELKDIAEASDQLNLEILSKRVVKNYLCYPKDIIL